MKTLLLLATLALLSALMLPTPAHAANLLNVSFDPTRELYQQLNASFTQEYKKRTGEEITVNQSHGGSGKQARAVIDGLQADVVTLALAYDIDAIADKAKLLPPDWQKRLPNNSAPFTSTIVFVVKKGNPKAIHNWPDLIKGDNKIVVPNPKTSGGARWAYLAAYGQQLRATHDEAQAKAYITAFYKHAPILATGAREATQQFAKQQIGDVLVSWESEAHLTLREFPGQYEIVIPAESILAEPPVAVVDALAKKHGTEKIALAYLNFLYTPVAQEIMAKNDYRPRDADVAKKYADKFPAITFFTVDDTFGGWAKANATHFADKGIFDQITNTGGLDE